MFKPILQKSDLPPPTSTSGETLQLDFKVKEGTKPKEEESFEKAKDVAAFANSLGGTILLGAPPRLNRYVPLTKEDAEAVARRYDESVRDRCYPKPVFNIARIGEDDGLVVVINVWPFPGQPVGVKSAGDERAFAFPVRVGTNTTYLSPDQLPMFMLPDVRRVAILLSSIPLEKRGTITLLQAPVDSAGNPLRSKVRLDLKTDDVVMKNTVRFQTSGDTHFTVPADCISRVWEDIDEGWFVATTVLLKKVDGRLMAVPLDTTPRSR